MWDAPAEPNEGTLGEMDSGYIVRVLRKPAGIIQRGCDPSRHVTHNVERDDEEAGSFPLLFSIEHMTTRSVSPRAPAIFASEPEPNPKAVRKWEANGYLSAEPIRYSIIPLTSIAYRHKIAQYFVSRISVG